jgi:hypothetical protein
MRIATPTVAVFAAASLLLAGCAVADPYAQAPVREHLDRPDDVGACARLLRELDGRVDAAGIRDAGAPRVPGFPYLRVDRFTASLGERAERLGTDGAAAWVALMAAADRAARAAEQGPAAAVADIDACRDRLAAADRDRLPALRAAASVPDDYSLARRAIGLYPLTRIPFAQGVRAWQHDTREVFAVPLDRLARSGTVQRYAPASGAPALAPPAVGAAALGLPAASAAELAALAARHAPLLEVDTATDDDRPGALRWSGDADRPSIGVDTRQPLAYLRAVHTHFAGQIRLQLVYTFWFPARPPTQPFDLLAGRIDGLVWRVTLDEAGAPLVYDSIHPCGCYHLFFPTATVAAKPAPDTLDEGLFAPQTAPDLAPGQRITLHIGAGSHDLRRVTAGPAGGRSATAYRLQDEQALRRLPWPAGGTRSAYGPDGLVPGTERAERWLFWPMGIASAGQMRQWGRHATAFVGRRHFDDPSLLDAYFALPAPRLAPAPP